MRHEICDDGLDLPAHGIHDTPGMTILKLVVWDYGAISVFAILCNTVEHMLRLKDLVPASGNRTYARGVHKSFGGNR